MSNSKYKIILASSSPRREDLLKKYINNFDIITPNIEEDILVGETPLKYVKRLSKEKALEVRRKVQLNNFVIIAADTIVELDNVIYNKPKNIDDAKRMLTNLMGRKHTVITSVYIIIDGVKTDFRLIDKTYVTFIDYNETLLNYYLSTNEYADKAGSYAIQGRGHIFIKNISGDYENIVGLPIAKILRKLKSNGIDII